MLLVCLCILEQLWLLSYEFLYNFGVSLLTASPLLYFYIRYCVCVLNSKNILFFFLMKRACIGVDILMTSFVVINAIFHVFSFCNCLDLIEKH